MLVRRVDPAHEHGRVPALREYGRRAADDVPRDGVAGHAAVAEQVFRLGRNDVRRVGEFSAARFALESPFGGTAGAASLDLHSFNLQDGTILGLGTTVADGESMFAITGGTGRYAGARGTYVARQNPRELGGDGTAEFRLSLVT